MRPSTKDTSGEKATSGDIDRTISRRQFFIRSMKAAGALAATCALGFGLYDEAGPQSAEQAEDEVSIPNFALPGGHRLSIVTGSDRGKTLGRALEALGGIGAFVAPRDRVLIKVNAAFASPPILSATTHPDLVAHLSRLCLKAGAASVVIVDNPINDAMSCFALTGIGKAAESEGARVVIASPRQFRPISLAKGKLIRHWPFLYAPFEGVNKLIGVAPVKDHHRSGASMTMKNWYGLLGGRRNIFHQDIHNLIMELAMLVSPTFVVLDGTTTMMTNGPTGGALEDLKETNTMIVSTDQVAADAVGAGLLERPLSEIAYISKAAAAGVGSLDYEALRPVRDHVI